MAKTQLAAQLYTLRDFTKTPADIAETLKKVRKIGYQAVQLSALGPIDPKELRKLCDDNGLTVCATHKSFEEMRDKTEALLAEHKILGCEYTAVGSMPQQYRSPDGWKKFAKDASAVAKKLKKGGLTWGYHNHSFELEKFGDRTGLEILYAESDPKYFTAEIDTYWITHGGGDPAQWVRDLKGRIPLLHLKDMCVKTKPGEWHPQQLMAEIGEGNLNWEKILKAAKKSGVRWYIVEQDTCQRDPFESLAISYKNCRKLGLK
ncbi:MAG TPA: sugar phosphate isomerase/epimerase [Planctomycetota bacterium]|jgi:sugar phosphate isomerase/epimerase